MDNKSARALVCAKLGPVGDIVVDQYVADVRRRALKSVYRMAVLKSRPFSQCEHIGARGRCRKTVTKAAAVQLCGTHQFFPTYFSDVYLEEEICTWA